MSWYDLFARVYDHSVERVYAGYRARIAAAADLRPGDTVLDVPVGTGPNLPHLASHVGPTGCVVGCDLSEGMLDRARRRALGPDAPRTVWIAGDVAALDAGALAAREVGAVDAVVVCLGLTVFPRWEDAFDRTWALLRPGGTYVVFDIHQDRWVPQSTVVRWMAQADMTRRPWERLAARAQGFDLTWLEGSRHVHGGRPYLAVGRRPAG